VSNLLTKETRTLMGEVVRTSSIISDKQLRATITALLDHADEADRVIGQLREALEPFLDHDCENPARCRMMRSLNQGAVLCRICEAQAAPRGGKEAK